MCVFLLIVLGLDCFLRLTPRHHILKIYCTWELYHFTVRLCLFVALRINDPCTSGEA